MMIMGLMICPAATLAVEVTLKDDYDLTNGMGDVTRRYVTGAAAAAKLL